MRHPTRLSALAPALLLAPLSLAAQDAPDTTTLRPVVVTATRVPIAEAASPVSVTVLDGRSLRQRGITLVADALREVPGLQVVQSGSVGGTTSVFLRGGNSNYVKVLVDGVPANAPGGAFDFANLTTDNVERIEVARGPASVLYGSDAVAGVVQIFTRRGGGPAAGSVLLRGGTFDTRDASLEASGGRGRIGYSGSAARFSTGGFLPFNNEYRNNSLSGQLRVAPSGRSDVRVAARFNDATFHYPTNGAGQVVDSNAVRDERRLVVALDGGHRFTDRLEARVLLGANELAAASDNQPDSPGDTTDFYSHDETDLSRLTADVRLNYALNPFATVTAGSELQGQQVTTRGSSQFGTAPAVETPAESRHRTNLAGYGQLLGFATPALSYTASARVDHNSQFGTFATARASLGYRFATGMRVRGAVGNAFKEPAFDETFATPFSRANLDLEPERTRSWEAGVEQTALGDRLVLSATYFDQHYRNLVQYVPGAEAENFVGSYANLAGANARGVELEGRLVRLAGFDLGASYTALRTRVTDAGNGAFGTFARGERLLRRPASSGTLTLGYRVPRHLSLNASATYVGERDDRDFTADSRVRLAAYTRLDASADLMVARRQASGAGLAITARVDNLTDRGYEPIFGFPAPGRTVLVGLRIGVER